MLKNSPPSDYCRLCVKSCNDYQHSLYDETGQANSNHDLVGKYFTNAMLNMEWERRLQYICGICWQHIWEFHQFQQSVIETQKGPYVHIEVTKEVGDVKIKPEVKINQQAAQLEWQNAQECSASIEDLIKPTVLTFDIKTEEPLELNSDYDGKSSQGLEQLTDDEMSLISTVSTNDVQSNVDYSSNDELPLSSMSHNNLSSSESKFATTKRTAEEFDKLVALWQSSLECDLCHLLVPSYSQLEEHFRKNHASEVCYLMCCQLRLANRYDIEKHIHYHNAPEKLRCETCCKAYRLEKHLRNHKRIIHTSNGGNKNAKDSKILEGPYRCCKCSKDFATNAHLSIHNLDVHKPKVFECNICEKSFTRSNALRQHMSNHIGERNHACSFCPKSFTCRAYFCKHMRKQHPQEWKRMPNERVQRKTPKSYRLETRGESKVYVCFYCSKEYEKLHSIRQHLYRRHGMRKSRKSRVVRPKTTDVSNITPDGDTLNELGKVGEDEEDSLMTSIEGKELKEENATSTYIKSEHFSADANSLENEDMEEIEMPQKFEDDATGDSDDSIASEEEFIEL
ncbi:zinc finger protein 62 homolog [Stomoxys calcitrans]|uniref:zinc finger protein 62 homolog n=1 Tax=Stomoxys calcitrans TaxID=35570 RepID=UPI0027E29461|nr:zinc finger protein 62 homolog [Stomoxys calcitrans]